jgi:hypothetical protein
MRRKPLLLGTLLLFLFSILASSPSFAQYGKRAKRAALKTRNRQISRFTVRTDFSKAKKYISYGGGMGMSNYFGDLAPRTRRGSSDMRYTRSYMSAFYLHRIHPHITIRGSLSWMRLRGDDFSVSRISSPTNTDKGRFVRNLHFRNDVFELAAVGIFDLFPTDRGYLRRNFFNPYGILGLSFFKHNPQAMTPIKPGQTSKWVDLQPLGTEGQNTGIPGTPSSYSLWQIGVPLGIGIRYRLADKWDLGFEMCYRFVFTDYIDDVSSKYPTDEVYQKMADQGNFLGIEMSDRSVEATAAVTGDRRQPVIRGWGTKGFGTWDISKTVVILENPENGEVYRRFASFESDLGVGQPPPRGNKRRDYWMVTALHLAYIMEIKQKPPKFR